MKARSGWHLAAQPRMNIVIIAELYAPRPYL
ncbi:MAG: hypothetical protein K0R62_6004 [Nonomuraea muscovyensis]|nr:hypothetical protein [Nonomuraea muscovyensis]